VDDGADRHVADRHGVARLDVDLIAGDDDLQPLESFDAPASNLAGKAESTASSAADTVSDTASSAKTKAKSADS